jgi:hypothetical protein
MRKNEKKKKKSPGFFLFRRFSNGEKNKKQKNSLPMTILPAGAPPTVMSKKTLSVTFPESPAEARAAKERREWVVTEESVSLRGAATEGEVGARGAADADAAMEARLEAERTAEMTTERAPRVVASVDACCVFVMRIGGERER